MMYVLALPPQDYSVALELEPKNSTAYHNRGALYERNGM